jgi:hypothetical protein
MADISSSATVVRESVGSMSLWIFTLTIGSTSDTLVIDIEAPVIDYWTQAQVGTANYSPDVTWTASTGTFLITGPSHNGTCKLFVLFKQ